MTIIYAASANFCSSKEHVLFLNLDNVCISGICVECVISCNHSKHGPMINNNTLDITQDPQTTVF